ncbi:BAG domain-containing protein Samui isoform X1 [Drosophila persimilis]|uniref:BAG domain-containing protein Samui isoform X1 n=2 Tax=Drosophila pseudoobscura pseudoobscura TaxID=46245 RepID=A0A6I8VLG3_DROPS|nr:BAG domain-containing protein Samui isoform X1 [Drosophila pseudoobscura]XP_026847657.1 BAG domain-containing protein Samui isoform X1 [Drosophila persimilis]
MKPTVIAANQAHAQAQASAGGNGGPGNVSGINIPINREYVSGAHGSPHQQQPHPQFNSSTLPGYGSPRQRPPHQQQHPQQQVPTNQQQQHFQQPTFGFEPDMDMDMDNMFPRSRLGRMHHDPFAGFGDTRKRSSLNGPPQTNADDAFSSHFDDADFGFPQFSTMGRRGRMAGGANNHMDHDDDFFNRLPSEFRQYIPDGFGARRGPGPATGVVPPQQPQPQAQQQQYPQQYYQQDYPVPPQQQQYVPVAPQQQQVPQSPSKRLCDAAIQTEDPAGRSEVDCAAPVNLNQHGLRNTVDMGVKSVAEQDQAARSHSAPPPEQQQQNLVYQQQQQQRPTPPPGVHQSPFGTQTSPPVQGQYQQPQQPQQHPPQFKSYYAPHQQTHPQQKQQTPPPAPQTPGGSFVRTIPIFVEGRTEPIINAHKEIPNQNAPPSAQAQAQAQAHASAQAQAHFSPQQSRPTPLNTQQQQAEQQVPGDGAAGLPPQTPHTLDSINKIQDIQRDVLELMTKVEQFKGMRQEKEYAYLDEMLTRNLLKLDTIDTNGKDSIRLARKEAIKCIQASINVLEAKAEENARLAAGAEAGGPVSEQVSTEAAAEVQEPITPQPQDATKIQEPIPLPPPPSAVEAAVEAPPAAAEAAQTVSSTETTTSTSE